MFRCQLCQKVVPAGVPTQMIVLTTRSKTYRERGGQFSERGGFRGRGRRNTPKSKIDKGGEGSEIVREASVCPTCAAEHEQKIEREQSLQAEQVKQQSELIQQSDSNSEDREQPENTSDDT